MKEILNRNKHRNFILDSGAFTLFSTKNTNLENYIQEYINFVKQHQIKQYIELDIGVLVGYEKVLEIREKLTKEIGYPPIPVWHNYLPYSEFENMCKQFDYISIGGIANKEIKTNQYDAFKEMNRYAKKQGTRTHGLGFTTSNCKEYGFYSVDSSSWTSGRRFGQVVEFKNNRLKQIKKPNNTRADYAKADQINFLSYIKFQRFVDN